jgi:hypothetical protein
MVYILNWVILEHCCVHMCSLSDLNRKLYLVEEGLLLAYVMVGQSSQA